MSKEKILTWVLGIAILFMVLQMAVPGSKEAKSTVTYDEFLAEVKSGRYSHVYLPSSPEDKLVAKGSSDSNSISAYAPVNDIWMVSDLLKAGVKVERKPPQHNAFLEMLDRLFPTLLFLAVWIFMMKKMGGGGGLLTGGKTFNPTEDASDVTFDDVAGCDEAKEEVQESVEYLKNPEEFSKLGGEIPKGILMDGDPGNGKTLLAKAMAGEAGVPFIKVAGSDFVELFAGMGARKVRQLFENARKHAPCIVFIDEIDAVGKARGASLNGNDEREQTLNQLLVEMDGFEGSEGILVIAATNRPELLDPALVRPGRFSRHVHVGRPDMKGREQVLKVHGKKLEGKKSLGSDVDWSIIARGTPGFSGADLANLINEAALFATRKKKKIVEMVDFEQAKDKIIMGKERKSIIMDDEEKTATAYHEAGHAVVGVVHGYDPIHKVTIIPHGRALGLTVTLPEKDVYSYNKKKILSDIAKLMGGRAAEELFLEDVGTGASNDMERATSLANSMVTKWGMSEKIGPMVFKDDDYSVSPEKRQEIDGEIRRILDEAYKCAIQTLKDNKEFVQNMVKILMEKETIDKNEILSCRPSVNVELPTKEIV